MITQEPRSGTATVSQSITIENVPVTGFGYIFFKDSWFGLLKSIGAIASKLLVRNVDFRVGIFQLQIGKSRREREEHIECRYGLSSLV